MSSILYYSNFCEHSKKLLQVLSKTQISKDIHFICIDKRVNEGGKIYVILENQQKLLLPENVAKVPALLLLTNNQILYGEHIYNNLKSKQEVVTQKVTQNNMEPMAFSLGNSGGFSGVTSDQYSFLDMEPESMTAKGDGGLRQMHNYVHLNHVDSINTPAKDESKPGNNMTIEQLQKQRDQEFSSLNLQQQRK
jgi:hypothetical protein